MEEKRISNEEFTKLRVSVFNSRTQDKNLEKITGIFSELLCFIAFLDFSCVK